MENVTAYSKYEWDCSCGWDNSEDHDPSGEEVTCQDCEEVSVVWQVM